MPFGHNDKNFFNYLDNMERNFFGDITQDFSQFRTDIIDKGNAFLLQAELPGFSKEDIKINIENKMLTIQAEHISNTEEKKENFVRRERKYGSFSRSFDISAIDMDQIKASYENGILSLELPKKEPVVPANRQIEIK